MSLVSKRCTITFAFALLLPWGSGSLAAVAQSADTSSPATDSLLQRAKTLITEGAYLGSIDSLRQARALAKRATGASTRQALAHYYAALADYRLNNQFPEDAEKKRENVLGDATTHLKKATELDSTFADAWALLAGVYGQRMGLNPMTQGMMLGSDTDEALSRAKELSPSNPRVWIIDGTSDFFTPSMFGGDKERALEKFKKAARLAEQESIDDPLMPSWGHAEAFAWIGIVQMDAERYEHARTAFEKALSINPDYGWVKYDLLPRLQEQQRQ
jgi:tetratricopeptide (TPR) repeat protein